MSAMSVGRALAPRSIHLRIIPRPANLSESREIFRVLQRFGEISTFKYLQYEYHSPANQVAFAIYRDESAAQQALNASPIRFALEKVITNDAEPSQLKSQNEDEDEDDSSQLAPTPTKDGISDILRPSQLMARTVPPATSNTTSTATATPPQPPMPFEPPSPPTTTTRVSKSWTKWFQVTVDRSRVVHQDFIERQPYWKQFHPMKSMAQQDLAKQVPHEGLSDVSKRPPNAHVTPIRVLKAGSQYVERRMPTLKGMVEDSEGERQFRMRRGL